DITNKIKLSPMNNSRGRNAIHSAKLGQFDRNAFKQSGESLFDEMFGFERNLKDSINYTLMMKKGDTDQKKVLSLLNQFEIKQPYSNQELSILDLTRNIQRNDMQILETAGS